MQVCETERLRLRHLTEDDAEFLVELLNDPDFVRNIADRGVRSVEDARRYLEEGPAASYRTFGHGLFLVELRDMRRPIGLCGLLKRDYLTEVDLGFALLPAYRGQGYALEAAAAVMAWGREALGLERVVAITSPHNEASMRLLAKLGLEFERMLEVPGTGARVRLFVPAG